MNITTFNPQIITKDAEPIIQLFRALGFEKQHNPKEIGELKVEGIRMKDKKRVLLGYFDAENPASTGYHSHSHEC